VAGAAPSTGTHLIGSAVVLRKRGVSSKRAVGGFSVAEINRYRDARATLSGPAIASLYARWLLHSDGGVPT